MCFKAPLLALTVRAACELEASKGLFAGFLKHKKVGEVGIACYEIYLIHVIVYGFVEKLHLSSGSLFLGIAYVVSIFAGLAFYQYFGKPSQEIAKNALRVVLLPKKKILNPLAEKTS
jgi:peptidoglycan/LPS O-acetylase OafA/YrhL